MQDLLRKLFQILTWFPNCRYMTWWLRAYWASGSPRNSFSQMKGTSHRDSRAEKQSPLIVLHKTSFWLPGATGSSVRSFIDSCLLDGPFWDILPQRVELDMSLNSGEAKFYFNTTSSDLTKFDLYLGWCSGPLFHSTRESSRWVERSPVWKSGFGCVSLDL